MSKFIVRDMEEKDIETIYSHIHQNYINKYFKNERKQKELHNKKYESIIHSKKFIFHIFEDDLDNFIAMVSYKRINKGKLEMGIYLNRKFRGKKYSENILKKSIEKVLKDIEKIEVLEAKILEENIASKKIFSNMGFKFVGIKNEYLLYNKYY